MGKHKKKKPEIRFKGFTDDWEQRKLEDIAKRVQGNDGRMNLPTLTISAAVGWMNQLDRFYGNIAGKEQQNYTLLHRGDLSYNHGNSKLAKYGTVFSLQSYEEALVPRVYHSFRMINSSADFIEYYFATRLMDRELSKLISSGARMDGLLNISYDEFVGMTMKLPSIEEQNKIAGYFRKVNSLIALHQRKLNKLKNVKKSMLEKMFPQNGEKEPQIRFCGFNSTWEQRKVSEIGNVVTGSTPQTSISDNYGGEFLFVSPADIQGNRYVDKTITTLKKRGFDQGRKIRAEASLFVSIGSTIGKVAQTSQESVTNQQINAVEPYDNFDDDFIFSSLENISGSIKAIASNQAVPIVNKTTFGETDIPVPSEIVEQKEIGTYFKQIDSIITLYQRKLEKLKKIKKAMLEKMFV